MKKNRPEIFSNHLFRELVEEYVQGETTRRLLIRFYVDELTLEELEAEEHISVSQIKRKIYPKARIIFRMMGHK